MRPEPEYYRAQAGSSRPILALSFLVALLMGVASVFGAINTMQASLSSRRTEIACLRAIGFSDWTVAGAFLVESLLQTLPAGVLGCALAFVVDGRKTSMMNMLSLGSVGFQLSVTPSVMAAGVAYALLIGVVSGIWPALSTGKIPLSEAMRR